MLPIANPSAEISTAGNSRLEVGSMKADRSSLPFAKLAMEGG